MNAHYKVGDLIHYMKDNKYHNARILSSSVVITSKINACTVEQKKVFEPFGKAGVKYATCHGIFDQEDVASSKEALFEMLSAK